VRPHAVGPDIGAATLLFAASSNPVRFQSLVVGSGSASVPLQLGVELKQFVEAPDVEFLRGANPRDLVNTVLNYLERYELPEATREDYVTGYLGDRFIDSLTFVRAYKDELPVLAGLLPEIRTPVQIIQGDHDPGVLPVNAEFLHQRLPHSRLDFVHAGHFAYEDRAEEYTELILAWWNGGYEQV
jgi:pimeloyl-ACP methyl ester carboxylesterase